MADPKPTAPAPPPTESPRASMLAAGRQRLGRARQAVRLVWQSSPGAALVLALLTALGVLLPLAIAYIGKAIVDAVVARSDSQALRLVALELSLMVASVLVGRGAGLARSLVGARLAVDVNVLILEKALTLDLRHFQDPEFYDQLTRARREASSRPLSMISDLLGIVQSTLTLFGYIGLLWTFSPLSVLVLLLAALPAAAGEVRFSKAVFRLRNFRAPEARRLNYIEYVLASDEHAKEVMVQGLGPTLLARYRTLAETLWREDRALALRRTAWGAALSLVGTAAFYGCYLLIVGLAARGRITLGDMTLYVVAFRQGQALFQSSLSNISGIYEHDLYLSNLFGFLSIPTSSERRLPPPAPAATTPSPHERGIRFDGVGFRYPGQDRPALADINLFIPAGQSLALVGHNGAGKSTFIKLLAGLYEPTEGRVLIDGVDVRTLSQDTLRQRIAVVFQDFNQYQFSLRDNVGFGSPQHLDDTDRVGRAIERGGADEIIGKLPEGLETQLGRWFQKGVELSGGQWQRIALSRAFMREQADILILDEPTAALDAEAEQAVFERFRQLSHGRTSLLISHRFPTVRMADHIVVIEDARIVEQGTHDQLLTAGGRYATMFHLQAAGYR